MALNRARLRRGHGIFPTLAACGFLAALSPAARGDAQVKQAWIGNTASPRHPGHPAVQGAVTDLWVDRDGTAYMVAPADLAGQPSLSAYRGGRCVATYSGAEGFVIGGNRTKLFVGSHGGVQILPKLRGSGLPAAALDWLAIDTPSDLSTPAAAVPDGFGIRGLHATERHLYLSNAARNRVEEWDLHSRKKLREWPFARPGALVLDPWGDLWVIRERLLAEGAGAPGRNDPRVGGGDVLQPASVVRLRRSDGRVMETLSEAGIPTALAIRVYAADGFPILLVADNGPRQQILRYGRREPDRSEPLPPLGGAFGILGVGGPREVDRCFNGLTGLGVSVDGTVFIAQNWEMYRERRGDYVPQAAEVLGISPDGTVRSAVRALYRSQPASILPMPPYDVYFRNVRLAVDWSSPGLDWTLAGRTTHPAEFPEEASHRGPRNNAVVRRVLGQTLLFEEEAETLLLYRRDPDRYGDVWAPAGAFRPRHDPAALWPARQPALLRRFELEYRTVAARSLHEARTPVARRALERDLEERVALAGTFGWFWVDGQGSEPLDGRLQDDEVVSIEGRLEGVVWSVDERGAIWATAREVSAHAPPSPVRFASWVPDRIGQNQMPIFRRGRPQSLPAEFATGSVFWHRFLPEDNRMLIAGTTALHHGRGPQVVVAYGDWTGSDGMVPRPRRTHQVTLHPHAAAFQEPCEVVALDTAGGWLFALHSDPVRIGIYDLEKGNRVATLRPGTAPLLQARVPQSDASLSTLLREDGGVSILASVPGWTHLLAMDWRAPPPSEKEPACVPVVFGNSFSRRAELYWGMDDCGRIDGYHVYRSTAGGEPVRVTTEPLRVSFFVDPELLNGQTYQYGVSAVAAGGEGPRSDPLALVPNDPVARFSGEDRRTLGNWRGTYGAQGYHLFGEPPEGPDSRNPREPEGVSGPSPVLGWQDATMPQADVRLDPALPFRSAAGRMHERAAGVLEVPLNGSVVFPVAIRNGRSVRVSLYCGSSERIHGVRVEVLDADTGAVLDDREFSNEEEPAIRGRYLRWDVTGTVLFRLSAPLGTSLPDQCGINAVFYDDVTAR